jgi:serine/alanine adding enzyme
MIDIDYNKFGLLRSRMVWFGEELPSPEGYHFVSCFNYLNELSFHHPYTKLQESTILIDLTKGEGDLFSQIHKRRRQKIRRGYKEEINIRHQIGSRNMLKEFCTLYNKFRIPKGNNPINFNWLLRYLCSNIILFWGEYNGQILFMELIVQDECTAYRFYNVRNETVKCPASTYVGGVLLWEIICHLKKLGCQILDLGGSNFFKNSFGGEIATTYRYDVAVSPIAKSFMKGKEIYFSLLKKIYCKSK